MKSVAVLLAMMFVLTGCAGFQPWIDSRLPALAAQAQKVKGLVGSYCNIRPETNLDDLALAAVALATSEKASDVIRSGMDKVCEWVGTPK